MSTERRQSARTLRDSEGRVVCSCGCGRHPAPPRRTWFSDACVESWREKNDPAYIRRKVFERDRGICSLCGCDADEEYDKWQAARAEINRLADRLMHNRRFNVVWNQGRWQFAADPVPVDWKAGIAYRKYLLAKWGPPGQWTAGRSTGWDADHIIPVVEGGGLCGLENYRTLCHPCHKRVTAELAKRRAAARRGAAVVQTIESLPLFETT